MSADHTFSSSAILGRSAAAARAGDAGRLNSEFKKVLDALFVKRCERRSVRRAELPQSGQQGSLKRVSGANGILDLDLYARTTCLKTARERGRPVAAPGHNHKSRPRRQPAAGNI